MKGTIECACGCGSRLAPNDSRGRPRTYLQGHNQRGKRNLGRARPESENARTGRWRARNTVEANACYLERIGGCSFGRIEVHHRDRDPLNNDPANLFPLCPSHHGLVERGRIDLDDPVMPEFTVSSGKRRYKW